MKFVDRAFKTVAKPEGSPTFRLGNVTITSPSYDQEEAPVAVTLGATAYRVIDGRLHLPLPGPRYGVWTESDSQQAMVNRMLISELSSDGYRDLKARMDKESDIDLTETDRGHLLRERAKAYPIIGGVQHIPVPGPLIDVNLTTGTPDRDEAGRPASAPPMVTSVIWREYDQSHYHRGAFFTLDDAEQALEFARSLESDDTSNIPTIEQLLANVQRILPYEPSNISDIQIWTMACSKLYSAIYTPIHELGRDGVKAMMNLRKDLSSRMGVRDAFLDRVLTLGSEREYGSFLRNYDTASLEETLGPVLDHLAAHQEAHRSPTSNQHVERKLLTLLRPSYRIPQPILDTEELAALDTFHGMKP